MVSSLTILDWWVDPEETMRLTQEAQKEGITVAAQRTGLVLNEVVGPAHTFRV
jgi:hypothetical protein